MTAYVLYIQHVYGNATGKHLALRAAARETSDPLQRRWMNPWKIPTEILESCGGLMVDREFLAGKRHTEWNGSVHRVGYGNMSWIQVEHEVEDESVRHSTLNLTVDHKWSLWSRFNLDHGYDFVVPLIKAMPRDSVLGIKLACWKEIRFGEVVITKGEKGYEVGGEMHTVWDDESMTKRDFRWSTRSVSALMRKLDKEEDLLLKEDEERSRLNQDTGEDDEEE